MEADVIIRNEIIGIGILILELFIIFLLARLGIRIVKYLETQRKKQ